MTFLSLLRALTAVGVGLVPKAAGIAVYAPKSCIKPQNILSPEMRAGIEAHREELRTALAEDTLHRRLHIPEDLAIPPALAVVLIWLDVERCSFSQSERHSWLDRLSVLIDAGRPSWYAEFWATEQVVGDRLASPGRPEAA